MHKSDLDNCQLLESFRDLHGGDRVYSIKHGLGYVYSLYNDEVIVQFSNFRKRLSVDDKEIRKLPEKYLEKPRTKVEIDVGDKIMNYIEYKKKYGLTKSQIKEEKQKYVTINEALSILKVTKSILLNSIAIFGIRTRQFGRSAMIHRDDLVKLSRVL